MSAARLYTPEILALAVELAEYPAPGGLPLYGEARSATCGSALALGLALDGGSVGALGLRLSACAIGQASAAVFARSAMGRSPAQLLDTGDAVAAWLAAGADDGASPPDWPGLHLLAPARAYRARHGAILLPWHAARAALSNVDGAG